MIVTWLYVQWRGKYIALTEQSEIIFTLCLRYAKNPFTRPVHHDLYPESFSCLRQSLVLPTPSPELRVSRSRILFCVTQTNARIGLMAKPQLYLLVPGQPSCKQTLSSSFDTVYHDMSLQAISTGAMICVRTGPLWPVACSPVWSEEFAHTQQSSQDNIARFVDRTLD